VIVDFCDEASFANFARDAKLIDPTIHLVAALPEQSAQLAPQVLTHGADDIVRGPLDAAEFAVLLKRTLPRLSDRDELRYRRAQVNAISTEFIGRSNQTLTIFHKLDEISRSSDPVLISGNPGSGKKLLAWSLHHRSMRRAGPYLTVNCRAYPGVMLERELFGSTRRNVTGSHAGALTIGDGGTVVLENIEGMALSLQQRLLKVLESNGTAGVNVRIVCLTLKDLELEAAQGRFDPALLNRLKQRHIVLPDLRERSGDVVLIGEYFFRNYCAELGVNASPPEAGFWEGLSAYSWPGNVRELNNAMYRAALLCLQQKPVRLCDVQDQTAPVATQVKIVEAAPAVSKALAADEAVFKVGTPLDTIELEMIRRTVEMTKGNRTQAAKILGISVRSLYNKIIEVDKILQAQNATTPVVAEPVKAMAETQCA
jgi:two-component system response regulator AtoC